MSSGIWSAASGAVAQSTVLDVQANNIANASTAGFRADRAVFRQVLSRATSRNGGPSTLQCSTVKTVEPDLRAGNIVSTGRPLDVALRGSEGFFAVSTSQGIRYTRNGSLRVGLDGRVTTQDGLPYLDPDHKVIKVSPESTVTVNRDGAILADGVVTNSRLLVVGFQNPRGLEKEGDVLLRARPDAGKVHEVPADLETNALEMSNASAVESMTGMVTATRSFDMLSRVIDAFSSTEKQAGQIMGS